MAAYRRVYDSSQLQADCQERDRPRNPTLGNRVWATFYHHEFISKTAMSISLIPGHNSFRVLFDNIASVYFTGKIKRLETNVADGTQVTLKLSAEMLYRRSTLREISPSIGHVTLRARASGITT